MISVIANQSVTTNFLTMKRGSSAVVADATQATKKTKVDTANMHQGTTQNQDGWTKVEKRKKKKEVKLEGRRDVRAYLFFVTQRSHHPGFIPVHHHVADHHHHFFFAVYADHESKVYVFES